MRTFIFMATIGIIVILLLYALQKEKSFRDAV